MKHEVGTLSTTVEILIQVLTVGTFSLLDTSTTVEILIQVLTMVSVGTFRISTTVEILIQVLTPKLYRNKAIYDSRNFDSGFDGCQS